MTGPISFRGVTVPADELTWRFSRSSGPGGQSVNTSDSRVSLSFDVAHSPSIPEPLRQRILAHLERRLVDGVVTVNVSDYRSQHRNRETARARLEQILVWASTPPTAPRRPTRPTRSSVERRLAGKRRHAETKALRRRPE